MGEFDAARDASAKDETDKHSRKSDVSRYEMVGDDQKPYKLTTTGELSLDDPQNDIFAEALARYPNDDCIDTREENKVRRKLDFRILPVLGVCYFFYYVDKTTLYVLIQFALCKHLSMYANQSRLGLMLLSLDSDRTLPSKAKSIHGCQAVSTSVGSYGRSHQTF